MSASFQHQLSYEQLAATLAQVCQEKSEWAGLPIPIPDHELILEPRFPYQELTRLAQEKPPPPPEDIVNSWWSARLHATVVITRTTGKLEALVLPRQSLLPMLQTLAVVPVWPLAAEHEAICKLGELVSHHAMRCYMLTGCFLETSKRSGVTYLFRRLRPTVALKGGEHCLRVLACLCQHPVGFYSSTFGGCMVPTDEVISHLVMMRGDEHYYWRICNQHPPEAEQSGL